MRPIKKLLADKGIHVVAWETKEATGLGETGNIIKPESRWALFLEGDVVLDIGYGVEGAKTLNLLEGVDKEPNLKIYAVINISRPMTSTLEDIIEYVKSLGKVDGLINNTHLGNETTPETVQKGAEVVTKAAQALGIPIIATTAEKTVAEKIGTHDVMGNVVKPINRFMPSALW